MRKLRRLEKAGFIPLPATFAVQKEPGCRRIAAPGFFLIGIVEITLAEQPPKRILRHRLAHGIASREQLHHLVWHLYPRSQNLESQLFWHKTFLARDHLY